jgi:DNA adenine methylase
MPRPSKEVLAGPRPFLKWAGGKTQLLPQLERLLPERKLGACYHEPFVGSGALFFHLRRTGALAGHAVLSDTVADLIGTWTAVRDEPKALAKRLHALGLAHDEKQYYKERANFNDMILPPLERAALFVYLNKTGFNGLWRVNAQGKHNVPFGRQVKGPSFPDEAHLLACSKALQGVELLRAPFESVLDRAGLGDFVYFDPPYVPVSATAFFTNYAAEGFGPADQVRLRDVFAALDERGCRVMLSNSGTPPVLDLYARWNVTTVSARRAINSKATARGPVPEVIVRNYG